MQNSRALSIAESCTGASLLQLLDCDASRHGGAEGSEFGEHGDDVCGVIATARLVRSRLRDMSDCGLPCWVSVG